MLVGEEPLRSCSDFLPPCVGFRSGRPFVEDQDHDGLLGALSSKLQYIKKHEYYQLSKANMTSRL